MAPACPDSNPKNIEYTVCVSMHIGVFQASLLSFQAWPTSSYSVVLILYESAQPVVATVDPLICSPTLTVQEGNGGACPAPTTKTDLTSHLP